MIKRIRFVTGRSGLPQRDFGAYRRQLTAAAAAAPEQLRPLRVTAGRTLPDLTDVDPGYHGVETEWFADVGHARAFEAWWADSAPAPLATAADLVDAANSPVLLVEEAVLRGAQWLAHRRRGVAGALKQMALARRREGLGREEFAELWRRHAGGVDAAGGTRREIPPGVRGSAYVQNHPLPGDWAYDAVNEVYLEDLAGLRARLQWLRENLADDDGSGLFRAPRFLAVWEETIFTASPGQ